MSENPEKSAIAAKQNSKTAGVDALRIGFIGVGLIGHGIAKNIVQHGYPLTIMGHRNRAPVDDLLKRGANEASSIADLVAASDVLFLCVTSSKEVEDLIRRDDGILAAARDELIVVDCSTADPTSTVALAGELQARNVHFVDAPVGRTPQAAEEGSLNAYVGGEEKIVNKIMPILQTWTEGVFHVGPVGSGHKMKLVTQLVSMTYAALYAEAYVACEKTGVNPELFYDVISSGGLNTGFFQNFSKWVLKRDPNAHRFSIKNCAKDIRYYNNMADEAGMLTFIGNGTKQSFALAMAQKFGNDYMPKLTDALAGVVGVDYE